MVRATTASYGLFPEIVLGGDYGPGERLRGPEHGFSNPSRVAQEEVYAAFNHRKIACLVSVGAGKRPVLPMADTGLWAAVTALWALVKRQTPEALQVLENMATDCESVHEGLELDSGLKDKGIYFRFNQSPGQVNVDATNNPNFNPDDWSEQNVKEIAEAARQ